MLFFRKEIYFLATIGYFRDNVLESTEITSGEAFAKDISEFPKAINNAIRHGVLEKDGMEWRVLSVSVL